MIKSSFLLLTAFPLVVFASSMSLPVGKCRYPLPSSPGLDISTVEGEVFKYIYTPSAIVFRAVTSISMVIKKAKGKDHVYTELIRAKSFLGTPTVITFQMEDLGNGVLKKITKDGEVGYIASIVDIKGDVGMLYVCSDDVEDNGEDYRYVIARQEVDPETVKHPDFLFRAANEKFKFHGKFRKLSQHFTKRSLSFN